MESTVEHAELQHDLAGRDIEPFMARAMDDVVECIQQHGQYPAPAKRNGFGLVRVQFDMAEFIVDELYKGELLYDFAAEALHALDDADKAFWLKDKIEKALRARLEGSEIVQARARQLAEDE